MNAKLFARYRYAFPVALFLLMGLPSYALRPDEKTGLEKRVAQAEQKAATIREVSAEQLDVAQLAEQSGIKVEWHPRLGTPLSIRGANLGQRRSYSGGKGLSLKGGGLYGQDAIAVLDNLARFYRVRDAAQEFAVKQTEEDSLGFHHVRLTQVHQGIRVFGADLIVHFDKGGQAYQVSGQYVPDIQAEVVPKIDAGEAVRIAQQNLTVMGNPEGTLREGPTLVIFARDVEPQLAYELMLSYDDPKAGPGRWRYWIDALGGQILLRYNDVEKVAAPTTNGTNATITGSILSGEGGQSLSVTSWHENTGYFYLYNTNRFWYVYNVASSGYPDYNTYAYRSTNDWGASDRAEMSAARNFDIVQRYYREVHGRNSFNNSGVYARANAHEGVNYVNAFWDGTDFHFGDGNGTTANSLAVLDVCGHEFTHAVDEYSANLIYSGESGALNESFSDIFGACIEFYAEPDGRALYPNKSPGTADWLCGEDCWLSSVALRDLRNPSNVATVGAGNQQPSRYKGTYWNPGGEVHQNDGVQNFFFYLLCEGGSGTNDGIIYSVTGIGVTNGEKVAYRALTVYCTPSTDYPSVRSAWISAAMDLNTNWASSVEAAWAACGITVTPPRVYFFPLDTDPGWSRQGQWAFGKPAGLGGTSYGHPDPTSGATGTNVFGVNLNGDYSTAVGGPYYLTAGPLNFGGYTGTKLQFQRWLNTDYPPFVYATIEVSSNGTSWTQIFSNVSGVEIADSAWGKYMYDISAVADNRTNVYVRWGHRVGSSGAWAYSGWNIDDIEFLANPSRSLKVEVPAAATEGDGVLAGTGQVWLSAAATTNLTVALSSSDTTEVTVPASATIPAGQTNVLFDVTVVDDAELDGTQTAAITASASGYTSASANIAVYDNETAALQVVLPATATEGQGTVSGAVQVGAVPAANITVGLSSSDTTEIQVPASVIIPSGQTSAVFTATVVDDNQIDGPQTATVTAHVQNWTDGSATITVLDNESLNLTVTLPGSAWENAGVLTNAGSVHISGTLPTDLVVSLVSSNTDKLIVPSTVTIATGQVTGTFNLTLVDNSINDGDQTVAVTASAPGFTDGLASMLVVDDDTPPAIVTQPASQAVYVSNSVTFVVVANGKPPLSYQWSFNGTNLDGMTSASLTLTNVQFSQAGNYAVLVTNAFGSVISSNAVLTVNPPPPCVPPPSGLVSWWAAESNALDSIGGNNGTLMNGVDFMPGKVGAAFQFNGVNSRVDLGDPENLKFTNSFSIEAWIWINTLPSLHGQIFFRGDPRSCLDPYTICVQPSGAFLFHIEDDLGTVPCGVDLTTAAVATQQWKHVAAVFDASTGTMQAYIDGQLAAQTNTIVRPFRNLVGGGVAIGNHSLGSYAQPFNGLIDELAVYNRALSASEIQAIYAAGITGKCPVPPTITTQPTNQTVVAGGTAAFSVLADGTPPLSYQWSFNGTNLTGATSGSLTLTNVQLTQAGTYAVQVANTAGSTTSSNAMLTVNPGVGVLGVVSGTNICKALPGNASGGVSFADMVAGQTYAHQASGCVAYNLDGAFSDPDGKTYTNSCANYTGTGAVATANFSCPGLKAWSLVGKISGGPCIQLGSSGSFVAPASGNLVLYFNDDIYGRLMERLHHHSFRFGCQRAGRRAVQPVQPGVHVDQQRNGSVGLVRQ
ncbi:MAG: M4 family metallopeptidase [Verrucomicrobiia bacterium]